MQPVHHLFLALIALLPAALPSSTVPDLPAPTNVRIDSDNMVHIVKWDPVKVENRTMSVMYSVGFEMYSGFWELCINITETECNVTEKIPSFLRGKPKVRAVSGSRTSDWVVLPDFQPNRNTTIGSVKSLVLIPHFSQINVDFKPPFSPIPSEWLVKYKLTYWKEKNSEEKETVELSTSTYVLNHLESKTNYCVQVYAFTHYIKGLESNPVCESTASAMTLTLIVSLSCVFGFVLIFAIISLLVIPERPLHKARLRLKKWLDGPYRIPSDIIEYLEDPPRLEITQNTPGEPCDRISIMGLDQEEETCPDHSQPLSEKT